MSMQFPKGGFIQLYFDPLSAPNQVNSMWSWGANTVGELGQNDLVKRSSPTQVGALTTWVQVTAANATSGAIKSDGTLWTWGNNLSYGELGQNNRTRRSSPVQVGALNTWKKIAGGSSCFTALKNDGSLWSWGRNTDGRLGLNDAINRSSPVQIGSNNWKNVYSGNNAIFSIAQTFDNAIWTWGANANGELGKNDLVFRSSPVQVGALTNWDQVSILTNAVLAIKTDGTLWSWGDNSFGYLGHNDIVSRSSPVQVGALTNWAKIYAGVQASYAIKTDGTLWTWGYNTAGELGLNDLNSRSSPVQIGSDTDWRSVYAGSNSTFFAKQNNSLYAVGQNGNGTLGLNDIVNRSSPVQVTSGESWLDLAVYTHVIALKSA